MRTICIAALTGAALTVAACGGDSYTGKDLEDSIRPSVTSQLSSQSINLDDLDCIKSDGGGKCIAKVSDSGQGEADDPYGLSSFGSGETYEAPQKATISITVTKGDNGKFIWSSDQ